MMRKDFNLEEVLEKPLLLHLSSSCKEGPRDSTLWFLYEDQKIWLFGIHDDSFVKRLKEDPRCALSVVDFSLDQGIMKQVGVRANAVLTNIDKDRLYRFVAKYVGDDRNAWNKWFVKNIVDPIDVMIEVPLTSVICKDLSFFN